VCTCSRPAADSTFRLRACVCVTQPDRLHGRPLLDCAAVTIAAGRQVAGASKEPALRCTCGVAAGGGCGCIPAQPGHPAQGHQARELPAGQTCQPLCQQEQTCQGESPPSTCPCGMFVWRAGSACASCHLHGTFTSLNDAPLLDCTRHTRAVLLLSCMQVKLIDLGMAGLYRPNKPVHGCMGSPGFIAPEVILGEPHTVRQCWLGVLVWCAVSLHSCFLP
jgi:hypothetical protein